MAVNPIRFFEQVRDEARKVTWPTRRETMTTSIMVVIMIIIASVFFLVVDTGLSWAVNWLLYGWYK